LNSPSAGSLQDCGVALPQRQSTSTGALKQLKKLADQLEMAKDASETTTKEVQHARRTTEHVARDVRRQRSGDAKRKRILSKGRHTEGGKSKAAVELGRKGGVARAKTLTRRERSAVAIKAAKARWNKD
jgi:hypothetical protein